MTEDRLKEIEALAEDPECFEQSDDPMTDMAEGIHELIAEVRRLQTMLNRAKHEGASCVMLAERCNTLERERDEIKSAAERWLKQRDLAAERADTLERERDEALAALRRLAETMGCKPDDNDDLVEAVRLLVRERDEAIKAQRGDQ